MCLRGWVEKFLGFMVNQQGIETNPEKIKVLLEISLPKKPKAVMSLAGMVAIRERILSIYFPLPC